MPPMNTKTPKQIQVALGKVPNMAVFASRHGLALRTLWRVLEKGTGLRGTLTLIENALRKERLL